MKFEKKYSVFSIFNQLVCEENWHTCWPLKRTSRVLSPINRNEQRRQAEALAVHPYCQFGELFRCQAYDVA